MIRYGILGCGGHAFQSHAIPGKSIPELALTSICDINPATMRQFCEQYGASLACSSDVASFLSSGIDAVIVATPDEFHVDNLEATIAAGKHTLIEKPLAVDQGQLRTLGMILEKAKEKGLVITSCHPRRFDPPFLWLKGNTARHTEELGPVVSFDFDFSYHRPTAEWKKDRSLMLDHLNHEIDLLHFLYGHNPFSANLDCDGFDRYQVSGKREDGIVFRFHGTRRLENRLFLEWARVRHERGEVTVDSHTGRATVFNHETGQRFDDLCGETDYPLRFRRVMQNFADAISGRAENYLAEQDLWINNWLGVELKSKGFCIP